MLGLINWRLKVTINDGRAFIGQMLAFDKHMNLVLADCEEFRHVRPKKKQGETEAGPEQEMKRSLGLVILRGETVVSLSVEGPPPVQDDDKKNAVCVSPQFTGSPSQSFLLSASCWPWSRDAGWAWNGNGASLCVLYSYPAKFNRERLRLTVASSYSNSRPPGICETPDAFRATWHARCTSRFPPSRISAGRAIPPSSWVRWPPSRVRRSPGMLNGWHADQCQCDRFQPPPQ